MTTTPLTAVALTLGLGIVAGTARWPESPQSRPQAPRARETTLSKSLRELSSAAPLAVAHRGASADFPENTMPAFRAAVAAGAPMVELDFHETSDGILVVIHDAILDRTTDSETVRGRKKVRVARTARRDLSELDAGSWKHERFAGTRIPTLEEALTVTQNGSVTMIEHKSGRAKTLVELLRKLDLVEDVLVQSFDWGWLEELHRLEPRITIGALGEHRLEPARLTELRRTGASLVHWSARDLTIEDIAGLRRQRYLVCVYTINDDIGLAGAAALNLDAITTNRPARLLALQARGIAVRPRR